MKHGTRSCYVNQRCRCILCREAQQIYDTTYYQAHRRRILDRKAVYGKKIISFKHKQIHLSINPRRGICNLCGRKPAHRQHDLHHFLYDSKKPLANTIEVCRSCHMYIHNWMRAVGIEPT